MFCEVELDRCVSPIISPPSVSRLSRQFGTLTISRSVQHRRPACWWGKLTIMDLNGSVLKLHSKKDIAVIGLLVPLTRVVMQMWQYMRWFSKNLRVTTSSSVVMCLCHVLQGKKSLLNYKLSQFKLKHYKKCNYLGTGNLLKVALNFSTWKTFFFLSELCSKMWCIKSCWLQNKLVLFCSLLFENECVWREREKY
jgi:hypothetical protein